MIRLYQKIDFLLIFLKDFIYLFMRDTHTERERHRRRKNQAPFHAGRLMRDSIPGLQDHTPAEGGAKPPSHQGSPTLEILNGQVAFDDFELYCRMVLVSCLGIFPMSMSLCIFSGNGYILREVLILS